MTRPHKCHVRGCRQLCPPERLMCRRHWRFVPEALRRAVWSSYRPGQCDDKRPSREWIEAARAALQAARDVERSRWELFRVEMEAEPKEST